MRDSEYIDKRKLLAEAYPINLIGTLLRRAVVNPEITEDILAGIEYALSKLTDVEREVIKLRFAFHMTYKQIGITRGRSENGSRGITVNALRKLRRPKLLGYILYGKNGFAEMSYIFRFPWEALPQQKNAHDPEVLAISFEKLYLTVRSFNALRLAGYECVGDIVALTPEQIMSIKYLSKENLEEIALKLRKIGITDTSWNEFVLHE